MPNNETKRYYVNVTDDQGRLLDRYVIFASPDAEAFEDDEFTLNRHSLHSLMADLARVIKQDSGESR